MLHIKTHRRRCVIKSFYDIRASIFCLIDSFYVTLLPAVDNEQRSLVSAHVLLLTGEEKLVGGLGVLVITNFCTYEVSNEKINKIQLTHLNGETVNT